MLDSWQPLDQNRPCSLALISNIYNLFSCSLCSIQERGYQPISPPFIANPKAPSFPAAQLPGQTVLLNYCIFLVQCLIYLGMCFALKEAPVAAEEASCSRSSQALFLWYPQPLTSLFVLYEPTSQGQSLIYGYSPYGVRNFKGCSVLGVFPTARESQMGKWPTVENCIWNQEILFFPHQNVFLCNAAVTLTMHLHRQKMVY